MKGKVLAFCVIALLAMVSSAWTADVDGKWVAKVAGTMGQQDSEITLVFKADGATVTGTLNNTAMPGEVEFKEGKLEGDKISFSLNRNIGQSDMKVVWKGTVSGDEIRFTRGIEGGGMGAGGGMGGQGGAAPPASEIIANRVK